MLDNINLIVQRDPQNALKIASEQWQQTRFNAQILNPEHDGRNIKNIIIAGMGGSALAGLVVREWIRNDLSVPIEILRDYNLPAYTNENTLVIASSYSGNTEETISCLNQAIEKNCQIATISARGKIENISHEHSIAYIKLPDGIQPRMAVIYSLRAITKLLINFNLIDASKLDDIERSAEFLAKESQKWGPDINTENNIAKQIATYAAGRSAVFLSSQDFSPLAYKWKISWNETAKNIAFCNYYPEFNHNEFMGWTSHPIEKLFAIFNLRSSFDNERIQKRFDISDRLLSGLRPNAHNIELRGATPLEQMLWGMILADYVSIYLAILNGKNPTPVNLIEKLKIELLK